MNNATTIHALDIQLWINPDNRPHVFWVQNNVEKTTIHNTPEDYEMILQSHEEKFFSSLPLPMCGRKVLSDGFAHAECAIELPDK